MKQPDKNSKRSKKRNNRNFKSLEESSRKHKRNKRKQANSQFFNGQMHRPGEKAVCSSGPHPRRAWLYTAGGANRYH